MVKTPAPIRGRGPTISALDPWKPSAGRIHQLLTTDERAQLAVMSSIVRFKKREIIYREGDPAEAIFNINTGVVAAYTEAPDGREHIAAFLFAEDLFGLSAEGKYTNSTKAITDVTGYRLPVTTLRSRLSKDAELEFHVICKLCQELRQAQRHTFLLSEKRAVTKLAMFLQLIETGPNSQRPASSRNLSADGSLRHRQLHWYDASGCKQGVSSLDHAGRH